MAVEIMSRLGDNGIMVVVPLVAFVQVGCIGIFEIELGPLSDCWVAWFLPVDWIDVSI